MEVLIGIVVVVGIAWLFMSGTFKPSIKDTATLREHELESAFIELKKKILVTTRTNRTRPISGFTTDRPTSKAKSLNATSTSSSMSKRNRCRSGNCSTIANAAMLRECGKPTTT